MGVADLCGLDARGNKYIEVHDRHGGRRDEIRLDARGIKSTEIYDESGARWTR